MAAAATNRLFSFLPSDALAPLRPHLKTIELSLGDVVGPPGSRVNYVYFPQTAVISLVVELSGGEMIETAMIGRDGVFNGAAALDGKISLNKAIVQIAGTASILSVDKFAALAKESEALRTLLIRHEQVLHAQSQQSAACNAAHSVDARMCRWLLRIHDLVESSQLTLTQEFLAQMLGVTRPTVSIVANSLQKVGYIKYRRGQIQILDRAAIEANACECYGRVKSFYEKTFGASL